MAIQISLNQVYLLALSNVIIVFPMTVCNVSQIRMSVLAKPYKVHNIERWG
jgi:hypothetical protein